MLCVCENRNSGGSEYLLTDSGDIGRHAADACRNVKRIR